jgi:hypothetical protein
MIGGEVDWDEVGNRNQGNNGGKKFFTVPYLKLSPGQSARIRVVTTLVVYYQHFKPINARSPGKDYDIVWSEGGYKPSKKYAAYAINRADGNIIVWDFNQTILEQITSWMEVNDGTKPRDPDKGCDWVIQCKTVRQEGRNQTRYTAVPMEATPLTQKEREQVEKFIAEKPLAVLRAPTSPEEIAELYEAYKKDPENPIVPGSGKWYKARAEARKAAAGGSGTGTSPVQGASSFDAEPESDSKSGSALQSLVDDEEDEGSNSPATDLF